MVYKAGDHAADVIFIAKGTLQLIMPELPTPNVCSNVALTGDHRTSLQTYKAPPADHNGVIVAGEYVGDVEVFGAVSNPRVKPGIRWASLMTTDYIDVYTVEKRVLFAQLHEFEEVKKYMQFEAKRRGLSMLECERQGGLGSCTDQTEQCVEDKAKSDGSDDQDNCGSIGGNSHGSGGGSGSSGGGDTNSRSSSSSTTTTSTIAAASITDGQKDNRHNSKDNYGGEYDRGRSVYRNKNDNGNTPNTTAGRVENMRKGLHSLMGKVKVFEKVEKGNKICMRDSVGGQSKVAHRDDSRLPLALADVQFLADMEHGKDENNELGLGHISPSTLGLGHDSGKASQDYDAQYTIPKGQNVKDLTLATIAAVDALCTALQQEEDRAS